MHCDCIANKFNALGLAKPGVRAIVLVMDGFNPARKWPPKPRPPPRGMQSGIQIQLVHPGLFFNYGRTGCLARITLNRLEAAPVKRVDPAKQPLKRAGKAHLKYLNTF